MCKRSSYRSTAPSCQWFIQFGENESHKNALGYTNDYVSVFAGLDHGSI